MPNKYIDDMDVLGMKGPFDLMINRMIIKNWTSKDPLTYDIIDIMCIKKLIDPLILVELTSWDLLTL